jgi:hypothetical protein
MPPFNDLSPATLVFTPDQLAIVQDAAKVDPSGNGDLTIGTVADPTIPFPAIDPSEILPLATVGAAALTTAVIVRSVCSPSPAVLFTNVRLLPCYLSASVQEATASATSTVSRILGDGGGATGPTGTRDVDRGGSVIEAFRDGFERAIDRAQPRAFDEESLDRRLLAQIGIVLGTVYLAFLTVWFWATRLRWNPRT